MHKSWEEYCDLPWIHKDIANDIAQNTGIGHEAWMQDWPIEVAHEADLALCLNLAETEERDEYLVALLTIIIAKLDTDMQSGCSALPDMLQQVADQIRRRPAVVNYWLCLEAETDDECFSVTPWLRSMFGVKAFPR